MTNPKISIIIGCYNVAKFLEDGRLENIYNQTYSNWELILVDDGSIDGTAELLDYSATTDNRIRVIHKENAGLGSARNAGLDVASGEYVWSYDLDDEIEPDVLEKLCRIAEKTKAEVVCFGYIEHDKKFGTQTICEFERISCHSNKEVRDIYLNHLLLKFNNGFFWNKFYRRDFIEKNHIRFGNERIQQDEVFNIQVYKCLKDLELIPGTFYHYYIYDKGTTRSRFIPERFDIYKSVNNHFRYLIDYWNLNDDRFETYLNKRFWDGIKQCCLFNMLHHDCPWSKAEKKAELSRIVEDKTSNSVLQAIKKYDLNFENRLYYSAISSKSYMCIYLYQRLFSFIRNVIS